MDLPKVLADLRAAGVTRARYTENGAGESSIEVDFGPPVAPAGLVDAAGKPIDLDEGMGPLQKDPLGEDDEDEAVVEDPIHAKNFNRKPRRAAV